MGIANNLYSTNFWVIITIRRLDMLNTSFGFIFYNLSKVYFDILDVAGRKYIEDICLSEIMNRIAPILSPYNYKIDVINGDEHIADIKRHEISVSSEERRLFYSFETIELAKAFEEKIKKVYSEN